MATYQLDIVTPERTVYSGAVSRLTAPSTEGLFGVLPGHAALLTSLATGLLVFVEDGGQARRVAVSGGFAEVERGRVVVLAETAEPGEEVDVPRARVALTKALEELGQGPRPAAETEQLRLAVTRARSRLKAAGTE
jgi:F-type H+-transporting ATPase subunit epsilon